MAKGAIYGLYLDGQLAYKGTTKELMDRFGITYKTSLMSYCTRHHKFMRIYDVKLEEKDDRTSVPVKEKPYRYQYILDNIRLYGNSIITRENDLDSVVNHLSQNGYNVKVRVVPKHGRDSKYWVLEL